MVLNLSLGFLVIWARRDFSRCLDCLSAGDGLSGDHAGALLEQPPFAGSGATPSLAGSEGTEQVVREGHL